MRFVIHRLAVPAVAVLLSATAQAVPISASNIDEGLNYVRLTDASENATFSGAEVIDLRFTDALEESANVLAGRIRSAAQSGATLFVLVNNATDPLLRHHLAQIKGSVRSLIFIGPVTPELAPEIVTDPDIETERKACDAIAAGTPPADLIKEELAKKRFDEAALVRSHENGGNPHASDDNAPKKTDKTDDSDDKPAPLKDISLQRAVFLHRALLALGRLGGGAA